MWDFSQIAKHVSKNNLKTFYRLSVKRTEQFIHNIIRILVEKSMSWLEFFKNYYISSFVALEYHKCPDLQIQMSIVRAEKFVCLQTWLLNMASRMWMVRILLFIFGRNGPWSQWLHSQCDAMCLAVTLTTLLECHIQSPLPLEIVAQNIPGLININRNNILFSFHTVILKYIPYMYNL